MKVALRLQAAISDSGSRIGEQRPEREVVKVSSLQSGQA
jgi:hypothetical protein